MKPGSVQIFAREDSASAWSWQLSLQLFWRAHREQDSDLCACVIYMVIMLQWINTLEWTIVSLQTTELVFLTWKWCSSNFCVNLFLKKCLKKTWMKTDFLRHCLIWMLALSKSMHVVFVIRMFYFNLIMLNIFDHIWRLIHMYFQENFVSESTCLFVSQCLLKKNCEHMYYLLLVCLRNLILKLEMCTCILTKDSNNFHLDLLGLKSVIFHML